MNQFYLNDLYLSACLLVQHVPLSTVSKSPDKGYSFVFNLSQEKAHSLLQKHWSGLLVVPTKDFIAAVNELKGRLKSVA